MAAGALWGLLRIEYVRVVFAHLGYRIYLVSLASGKFRLRLYCFSQACSDSRSGRTPGAGFNYTGAAASRFLAGQAGLGSITTPGIIGPAFFAVIHSCRMGSASTSTPPVSATAVPRQRQWPQFSEAHSSGR
jgi:hypothetical protein